MRSGTRLKALTPAQRRRAGEIAKRRRDQRQDGFEAEVPDRFAGFPVLAAGVAVNQAATGDNPDE